MVITLIGYRGSGKTSVARLLASRWGWMCIDVDEEIERHAGKSIRRIFDESGEPEFRRIERSVISKLLIQSRLILSAGGGAILNAETREEMCAAGPVVWLQASIETLESRILGDAATATRRPDLTKTGGRAEIETLLALREPLYRQTASLTIATDGLTSEQVAEKIAEALEPIVGTGDAL